MSISRKYIPTFEKYINNFHESEVNEAKLKLEEPVISWWNDKEIQSELRKIKFKIIGKINGVLTIQGEQKELDKIKDLFGIDEGESFINEWLNESNLNESKLDDLKHQLHIETNKSKASKLKQEIGKLFREKSASAQEKVGNDILKAYRKEIGYWNDGDTGVYTEDPKKVKSDEVNRLFKMLPRSKKKWTYGQATGDIWKDAREMWEKKYGNKPGKWTMSKYNKWIKEMAQNGGANNAYDMARNAEFEPGLIKFVEEKLTNGESPLERIQWDIEMYA